MPGIRIAFLLLFAVLATAACGVARTGFGPAPVSGERCVGVPERVCRQMVADFRTEIVAGAGVLVGIQIVCTTTCTEANGDVNVVRTHANGQTFEGTVGWASPEGPAPGEPGVPAPIVIPTPPALPACIGLPTFWCDQQVQNTMSNLNGADPASITQALIRCTGGCTDAKGDGDSVVILRDGTRIESSWSYRSE